MGKFHPHGDAAIYDAMVRLAQEFAMRYCLSKGRAILAISMAIMRLRCGTPRPADEVARLLLDGIERTLSIFGLLMMASPRNRRCCHGVPNLLANGAQGIAVGMATSIRRIILSNWRRIAAFDQAPNADRHIDAICQRSGFYQLAGADRTK